MFSGPDYFKNKIKYLMVKSQIRIATRINENFIIPSSTWPDSDIKTRD